MERHSPSKMINALFNERGLAKYTCRVLVNTFDYQTLEYTGAATTRVIKGTGIPGNSTFDPLPSEIEPGNSFVRLNGEWVVIPDHRGALIVCNKTNRIFTMNCLGELPPGFDFYKG